METNEQTPANQPQINVSESSRRSFGQFHHEGACVAGIFKAVDGGDIRVIQSGEEFGFAAETRRSGRP